MESEGFLESTSLNCTKTNTCFEEARNIDSTCQINDTAYATYRCVGITTGEDIDWDDFFNTTSECEFQGGQLQPINTCLEHSNLLSQRPDGRTLILENSKSICTYRDILVSRCCVMSATTTAAPVSTTTIIPTTTYSSEEDSCPTCVCNENPCYNANQSQTLFGNSSNCSSTLSHHSYCAPVCKFGLSPSRPFVCINGFLRRGRCGCVLNTSMSTGTCSSTRTGT